MDVVQRDFERTLAYHGAPALAGIKSADLIAWGNPEVCLGAFLEQYQKRLSVRGIQIRVLCACRPRCLLLVYRPECLRVQLERPDVRAILAREGYPADEGMEAMLKELCIRLHGKEFPHEIGLFLGYPPEDVEGFCRHRGRDFKLCGCWKVYSDVERAQQCFLRYSRCRAALCRRLDEGKDLAQVFRVA